MKDQRYHFQQKEHSKGGKEATALAAVSFGLFVLSVCLSWFSRGSAGLMAGGIALVAVLLSAYGFFLGMRSFKEKNTSSFYSVVGSIASGVVTVGWVTVFLTGIK